MDHVQVSACAVSMFRHFGDIPELHAEAWALANADVLEYWAQAEDHTEQVRAGSWCCMVSCCACPHEGVEEAAPQ